MLAVSASPATVKVFFTVHFSVELVGHLLYLLAAFAAFHSLV